MKRQMEPKQKLVLVLLAAGNSQRFQGNKLLHDFHGKPMYRHLVDQVQMLPSGVFSEKFVVTQYRVIGDDLALEGFQVVYNEAPELGISHSIRLAIEAICGSGCEESAKRPAICFAVCDQPYLQGETVRKLTEGWRQSLKGLACLGSQGELGNPAIFSEQYLEELLKLTGDTGGKKVIRKHMDDLLVLEVEDERELQDIDLKEDCGEM